MKVWISKYALTQGVYEIEAEDCFATAPGMITETGSRYATYFHGEGKDWHRTRDGALLKAERMRAAKIASLRKQISRIEKMAF